MFPLQRLIQFLERPQCVLSLHGKASSQWWERPHQQCVLEKVGSARSGGGLLKSMSQWLHILHIPLSPGLAEWEGDTGGRRGIKRFPLGKV